MNKAGSFAAAAEQNADRVTNLLSKLTAVAEPGAVFQPPVTAHDYTVITASEVAVGMGVGFGAGGGEGSGANENAAERAQENTASGSGGGGAGGGGGGSMGRPVAVISIGPMGVKVEPITDQTKVALAFFTMLGAVFMSWRAMRRFGKS